jgi:hypothetical protein
MVRDAAAEVGAPLIEVERQKEGLKPRQVTIAKELKGTQARSALRCQRKPI